MLTLLDTCVSFIARNIHLVESFEGFPDVLGEKIFKAAEFHGKLKLCAKASWQALSLFTAAYRDLVLSSLFVEGRHLTVANSIQHLQTFTHLKNLNLACCGLGDDHEFLHHVSRLSSLQSLGLRDNALSDDGIRKMTAPIRVKKEGPLSLLYLDLSENQRLSAASLKFLQVFKQLCFLDVSSTGIKNHEQATKEFSRTMSLKPQKEFPKLTELIDMKTQGWAADTVQQWIQETEHESHPGCVAKPQQQTRTSNIKWFYGKIRPPLSETASDGAKISSKRTSHSALVLVSCKLTEQLPSVNLQATRSVGTTCSPTAADSSASKKHKLNDQLDLTRPPPAKVRKVANTSRTSDALPEAPQQCVQDKVQNGNPEDELCDEDLLLLKQYTSSGH